MSTKVSIPIEDYKKIIYGDSRVIKEYREKFEKEHPKTCEECGAKFLTKSRRDTLYCGRCMSRYAAATKKYQAKISENEALSLHRKVYKRIYARYLHGSISKEKFEAISKELSAKRKMYIKKEIPEEIFISYLNNI